MGTAIQEEVALQAGTAAAPCCLGGVGNAAEGSDPSILRACLWFGKSAHFRPPLASVMVEGPKAGPFFGSRIGVCFDVVLPSVAS